MIQSSFRLFVPFKINIIITLQIFSKKKGRDYGNNIERRYFA